MFTSVRSAEKLNQSFSENVCVVLTLRLVKQLALRFALSLALPLIRQVELQVSDTVASNMEDKYVKPGRGLRY